jgi:hypothetical protein
VERARKNGRVWWAQFAAGQWHVHAPSTNAKGKWEADPTGGKIFPGDSPPAQLARYVAELVKAAAMPG